MAVKKYEVASKDYLKNLNKTKKQKSIKIGKLEDFKKRYKMQEALIKLDKLRGSAKNHKLKSKKEVDEYIRKVFS